MLISLWGFGSTYAVFQILKKTVGIRVSAEDESLGLDISEHGIAAYHELEHSPLGYIKHVPLVPVQTNPALAKKEDVTTA